MRMSSVRAAFHLAVWSALFLPLSLAAENSTNTTVDLLANTTTTQNVNETNSTTAPPLPPPPPIVIDGRKLDGNAIDIVVFPSQLTENEYFSTPWFVSFNLDVGNDDDLTDADSEDDDDSVGGGIFDVVGELWGVVFGGNHDTEAAIVKIQCNGVYLDATMTLGEDGKTSFANNPDATTPPMDDLRKCFQNAPANQETFLVRYEHHMEPSTQNTRRRRRRAQQTNGDNPLRYVECRLHLWHPDDSIVVTDIDGTLTQESFPWEELLWGSQTPLHEGVAELHTKIAQTGVRTVYLTGRPISYATFSRDFLDHAVQSSIAAEMQVAMGLSRQANTTTAAAEPQVFRFPKGPLITGQQDTMTTILGVFNEAYEPAKAQSLLGIQEAMVLAGRSMAYPTFVAGFGDVDNDASAYRKAGMDESVIFMVTWDEEQIMSRIFSVAEPEVLFPWAYASPNFFPSFFNRLRNFIPLDVYGQGLENVMSTLENGVN